MLKRLAIGLLVAAATMAGTGAPAIAAGGPPITCPPGQHPDPTTGLCIIVVGGGGGGTATCRWDTVRIYATDVPCTSPYGYYSNYYQCYISPLNPPPPFSDPRWEGHTDGGIYHCYPPLPYIAGPAFAPYDLWSASPPAGPAAPPNPRVLAQQAVASMQLRAITIGLVPEPQPGSVGLVGIPNWMWVAAPSATTWGPITRSASAAGFTVTATAQVQQVDWNMGDGQVVSCGAGTPYEDSFGRQSSPTCGHVYTRQGQYTVRATSHWVITWSGIGQTGTITMDLTQTAPVTIGEAQVLKQ